MTRLETSELSERFLASLGGLVNDADEVADAPLTLRAKPPLPPRIRAYLFNATDPPGGRSTAEYKVQLRVRGQGRQERATLDFSGGYAVLVAGYSADIDAFMLWDASFHAEFGFSANLQIRAATVQQALSTTRVVSQLRGNGEVALAAPGDRLIEAITTRFEATSPPPDDPPPPPVPSQSRGKRYAATRPQSPEPGSRVFEVDPDRIDRGTQAHFTTQSLLADAIRAAGYEPLEANDADPKFDVAWIDDDGIAHLVEVKSRTDANEEKQLRLALGQILSYQYLLRWPGLTGIQPIIALESAPVRGYWSDLCQEHGVILTWPDRYQDLF